MARPQEAVRQIAKAEQPHNLDSGIVRTVRGRYIDVVLDGTRKQIRDVTLAEGISTIDVGYWVVVVRVPRSNRWTAIAALESALTGTRETATGLAMPSNLTITGSAFFIRVTWDGSFRDVATYELQHNSSASETGATMIKVDGCTFVYLCNPGTTRHFRVRAVDGNYKRTNWTSWDSATATYGESYMSLCVTASGDISWMRFDWDNVSSVAGADMVHNHHSAIEGGVELWPDRLGVGTASIPAMDGIIGLPEAADRPPFAPNEGRIYCKDVDGVTEFYYEDDQGREIQLTDDGTVNAEGTGIGDYIDLPEIAPPGVPAGANLRLYVENINGFSFFSFIDDTGMARKIVRDSVFVAKNNTGDVIQANRAVYAVGSDAGVPTVAKARANNINTMPSIGVTLEQIANGAYGRIMQVGLVENVDTSSFAEGDVLYVSSAVAGVLVKIAPLWPNIRQEIGVILVSDAAVGTVQLVARSMFNEGILDHGGLLGLADDDHTQYLLVDGTRAMTGSLGINTTPQGNLHSYGNCSGVMHWDYDGVDNNAQTVVANGAEDVTGALWANSIVAEKTGAGKEQHVCWLEPGESQAIYSDGTDTCTLAVAADGSVTVQRTAGADTFKVALWLMWI